MKKIDTYQCFFQLGAMSIDEIDELFRDYSSRIHGVHLYVSERLDARAEFTKQFDNCTAFNEDDFRNLATGSYGLRNNDVIIGNTERRGQELIISCCGNYPI